VGVLHQGFYKSAPNNAVPSPVDGDVTVPWWWDHLAVLTLPRLQHILIAIRRAEE